MCIQGIWSAEIRLQAQKSQAAEINKKIVGQAKRTSIAVIPRARAALAKRIAVGGAGQTTVETADALEVGQASVAQRGRGSDAPTARRPSWW